jgi:Spy/CpxP family protein refolding chaperone
MRTNLRKGGMEMKRVITVIGIIVLVGAFAVPASAHDRGWGKGPGMMGYQGKAPGRDYGRGNENLTEEQRSQLDELRKKFFDKTSELRLEVGKKSLELNSLMTSSDPDAEKATALQKEVSDLRAKLAQERITHQLEVRKIAPDARFGRAYGPHKRGYGPHRGNYGMPMGGNAPGKNWR